ncbi:MAG: UPF0104 family protein [Nevskiaceae bacterium]|nr:MAG: UPF0104 family protein [Nevskiaceae bacterium]TBR71338.1 MAG: UPF0104 family protein [Nevskiaceae bacterium]
MKMTAAQTRRVAVSVATIIIFALAIYALRLLLREARPADVFEQLSAVAWWRIAAAVAFTAGSYFMLTFFDYFAVLAAGHRISYPRTAEAALAAYGIGHTAGVPSLSGGSVRYRYYTPEGLSALEVAGVVTMVSLNFLLGLCLVLGLGLIVDAGMATQVVPLSEPELHVLGIALLAFVGAYLALAYLKRTPVQMFGKSFLLPTPRLAMGQLVVSFFDLSFSAAALYILIPDGVGVGFPVFVGVYVVAMQAGLLSNVPGGLGVFESVLLLLLPGAPTDELLGALVLYRLIYYALPFLVALAVFMRREAISGDGPVRWLLRWLQRR